MSGVDEDYAIGSWLFGCSVWLVGGFFLNVLGIPDVLAEN